MKQLVLAIIVLFTVSGAAMAQEQQVYSPYPQPAFRNNQSVAVQPSGAGQYQESPNQYMVYPGRERYGDNYGYIPRHPGDYRDAVDRGQWQGGGGAQMPRRSYSGY